MRKFQLSEVAEIINGGAWSDKEYVDNGIPVARVTNFHDYSIDLSDAKYLPESSLAKYGKHLLRNHDLVVSTVGSHPTQPNSVVGKPAIVSTLVAGALLNQNAVIVRSKDTSILDQRFLAFYGLTRNFRGYIESRARGAANQVRMSIALLKELEVTLPPIHVQRQVSNILIDLSDVIDNNTRRIAILEEMARRLYEEWFVHFRFPGHEQVKMVESELGLIPEGWSTLPVKKIVKRLKSGIVYKQKDVEEQGQVIVVDQSTSEFLGFHNNQADHLASAESPIAIFGDHTCKMQLMVSEFSIGPNTIPFAAADEYPIYYVYYVVNGLVETKEYKRHWTDFADKSVIAADFMTSKRFSDTVKPLLRMTELLRRKNRNLRTTRDLLLPKLISGELDVSLMPEPETEVA